MSENQTKKYVVTVGSLRFEQGTFKYGDTIDLTDERASKFDKLDIRVIPQDIIDKANTPPTEPTPIIAEEAKVEAKPLPKTAKKAKAEIVDEATATT